MNTPSTIRDRFPQFRNHSFYPDISIDMAIEDSIIDMGDDEARWGGYYDSAQANLVAHYLVILSAQQAGDSSTFKDTSSTSAGGVSITYSQGIYGSGDSISSTSYGQRYMRIRNLLFSGPVVI